MKITYTPETVAAERKFNKFLNYILSALAIFTLMIVGAVLTEAFFWGDDLSSKEASFDEAVSDLVLDEIQLRRSKRQLFSAHCSLIEYKINNGHEILNTKYNKACIDGDQVEYHRIRGGGK